MQNLIEQLRECAEWAESNIYDVPVILPDLLKEAAEKIEADKKEIERLKMDNGWIRKENDWLRKRVYELPRP